MCGISAIVTLHGVRPPKGYRQALEKELEQSLDRIKHRGPDSRGFWISDDCHVALGHVRLSIIDLSPSGAQPMHSGPIHIVVNGELYGYQSIRADLRTKGYTFKGDSDSEIVLALYAEYGQDFPSHLRGEFSVVLYDEERKLVIAVRDRYGVKPLYWTFTPSRDRLLIAAEVKALLPLGWKPEWDVRSILDCGWNYDDRTLFRGVKKVRPGHMLVARLDGSYDIKPYWLADFPSKRSKDPRPFEELVEGVRQRLIDSVAIRLRADVPVGIYLSGGIDSSVIAGIATHLARERGTLMGSEKTGAIKCFSIQFEDREDGPKHDEAPIAQRSAEYLGVDFRTMPVSEADMVDHFEEAVYHCEHPMPDLNFVAKFLLSDFATKEGYKVVLTGEGADETFAGYSLFCPDLLAEPDTTASFAVPEGERQNQLQKLKDEGDTSLGGTWSGEELDFPGKANVMRSINHLAYPHLQASGAIWDSKSFSSWTQQLGLANPVITTASDLDALTRSKFQTRWHPLHSGLYLAAKGPLPSMLLASLGDRSEMAHGLEARTPFLDHHLSEYVNGLPPSAKITVDREGGLIEKWVLREAAKPFVTPELYVRKKHPFSSPFRFDVGGKVHTMLTKHLNEEGVASLGFVDYGYVKELMRLTFEEAEPPPTAFRQCLVLAELVILGKAFGIPPAAPPEPLL